MMYAMMSSAYLANETPSFSRHEFFKALVDVGDEDKEEYRAKNAALYHSSLHLLSISVNLADAYSLRAVTEVASDPTHKP
jgi:hypothetical protein